MTATTQAALGIQIDIVFIDRQMQYKLSDLKILIVNTHTQVALGIQLDRYPARYMYMQIVRIRQIQIDAMEAVRFKDNDSHYTSCSRYPDRYMYIDSHNLIEIQIQWKLSDLKIMIANTQATLGIQIYRYPAKYLQIVRI